MWGAHPGFGSIDMDINLKKFALVAVTTTVLCGGGILVATIPAAAHVVCDDDGDDCWQTHPRYFDRDWDGWRRQEWHERREWEERRQRDAYRRWYWSQRPYYPTFPGYGGGRVWFNF